MAMGQLIGGRIGVYFAIKNGARLIRPIFISVVSTTIITLAYKSYIGPEKLARFIHFFGVIPAVLLLVLSIVSMAIIYLLQSKKRAGRLSEPAENDLT